MASKPMTEETKRKISAAHKGKPKSEAHIAAMSAARMGHEVTDETKAKIGAALRGRVKERQPRKPRPSRAVSGKPISGPGSPHWKTGMSLSHGRMLVRLPNHPNANRKGYVRRAQIVMEQTLGRGLTLDEVVHHIDGDPLNDGPENLQLFPSTADHSRYHESLRDRTRKANGQWEKSTIVAPAT